jgi:2-polyprenyl-3-methyl-5-hydroxy-6-metoxy-1,4-benzoquinol methylase
MTTPVEDDRSTHWESVYTQKSSTAVSWYRDHLEASLALLERAGLSPHSHVIDVGGGASTLVDDLLERNVGAITVLDLSAAALGVAQARLTERAQRVTWLTGDVTRVALSKNAYTHWHDRAAMHFLTHEDEVRAYAGQVAHALAIGGYAVIGGFAPDGPERCSGLAIARRSADEIAQVLGNRFELIATHQECHRTPAGSEQAFAYALLRRI